MSQHTNTANATIGQFKESIGKVIGEAQKAFGGLKGDDEMIARSHGKVAKGNIQRNAEFITSPSAINTLTQNPFKLKLKSTNMTDRMSNTYNSTIGTAKEKIGSAIGSESLAASGAEQRARGETAQKAADAKTHAEGLQNKAKGEIQKNVGSLTDNTSQQAKGHANVALGDAQRSV
ncbi:hypothetical protein BGW41_000241 [Actinomortierella wolfii]|nr:hypothetical protein BGW41_000241 [Actinomortierella wolfii]